MNEKECEVEEVFKKPTLVEDLGRMFPKEGSKWKTRFGVYECPFCGTHFKAQTSSIKNGNTKSCGCYQKSQVAKSNTLLNTTHVGKGTRLYKIWASMKNRTLSPKHKQYKDYGGRGIALCDDWKEFVPFRDWALSKGYSAELSIDRIDNDKGYEPNNCRWTTQTIQNRNRRMVCNNTSGFRGVSYIKTKGKFRANITINYKLIHLGYYLTAVEGAISYNSYIIENNLEGFILNTIPEENRGETND